MKVIVSIIGLVVVLSSLTGFLIWESYVNGELLNQVKYSIKITDLFDDANGMLIEEEHLKHDYLRAPAPALIAKYNQRGLDFIATLETVRKPGDANDQVVVAESLALQESYVSSVNQLFAVLDADINVFGNTIDQGHLKTDQIGEKLKGLLNKAIKDHKEEVTNSLINLETTHNLIQFTTPFLQILGLLLSTSFIFLLKNYKQRIKRDFHCLCGRAGRF